MPYPCQKPRLAKKQPNLTGLRLRAVKFINFGPPHALDTAAAAAAAAAAKTVSYTHLTLPTKRIV